MLQGALPAHHVLGNHCLSVPRATVLKKLGIPECGYYSVALPAGWRLVVLDTTEMSGHSGYPEVGDGGGDIEMRRWHCEGGMRGSWVAGSGRGWAGAAGSQRTTAHKCCIALLRQRLSMRCITSPSRAPCTPPSCV